MRQMEAHSLNSHGEKCLYEIRDPLTQPNTLDI